MALVYIEPLQNPRGSSSPGVNLSCGEGGGGSQNHGNQDQDQQRREERDRPLSEEHNNKRRKLKELELGQMMWGAPDKDG